MDRRTEKERSVGQLMDGYESSEIFCNFHTASCTVVMLDKTETAAAVSERFFLGLSDKEIMLSCAVEQLEKKRDGLLFFVSHLSFIVIAPAKSKYFYLRQEKA